MFRAEWMDAKGQHHIRFYEHRIGAVKATRINGPPLWAGIREMHAPKRKDLWIALVNREIGRKNADT